MYAEDGNRVGLDNRRKAWQADEDAERFILAARATGHRAGWAMAKWAWILSGLFFLSVVVLMTLGHIAGWY